ncbi:MAG: hypothetical protein D6732_00935 [Methanobacteriota archaeon]|nr:MAG: hypothetical protein D6732_00935 [Euryarchaeota archaeon]
MTLLGGSIDDLIPQMRSEDLILKPKKRGFRFFEILFSISAIALIYRLIINPQNSMLPLALLVISFFLLLRKRAIDRVFVISEQGLVVPSTWLTQRVIPWNEVVDAYLEDVVDEYGNQKKGLRITFDTEWEKLNYTGLSDPSLLLLEDDFDGDRLQRFHERLQFFRKQFGTAPDTLNQRLKKQVERAWHKRNRRIILLWIDSVTEIGFAFLLLSILAFGLTGSLDSWVFVLGLYFSFGILLFVFYWLTQRPYSILGLRPHELGAVDYLPDDVVTNIRFVLVCEPYPVYLKHAEMIYDHDENRPIQVSNFVQIHPEVVSPGELAHGVAQITGNHVQAKGAKITLSVGENETEYTIPIYWR